MGLLDDYLLTIITFLPLATGLLLLMTSVLAGTMGGGGLPPSLWRALGFASTVVTFLLSLRLFIQFDPTQTGFQFVEHAAWLPAYGIYYHVGIDGNGRVQSKIEGSQ